MDHKLSAAIGFAMRAGKCAAGDFACERALSSKKVRLIVLDDEACENTRERWDGQCVRLKVPIVVVKGAADAAGKPGKRILAVLDDHFARMILDAIASE